MYKIILGIFSYLLSMYSWSMCIYNFDVTQAQLMQVGGVDKIFPINQGQKIGFNIGVGEASFLGMSEKLMLNMLNTQQPPNGDIAVPTKGVFAFEYNVKLPDFVLSGNEGLMIFPASATGTFNSNNTFDINLGYLNNLGTQLGSHSVLISVLGFNKFFAVANTSDGYQRYGFYINQDLKKIGLIVNGVDQGYIGSFTNNPNTFYFIVGAGQTKISNNSEALNQNVSLELITDKSKLGFTYPTGTKDICGNPI